MNLVIILIGLVSQTANAHDCCKVEQKTVSLPKKVIPPVVKKQQTIIVQKQLIKNYHITQVVPQKEEVKQECKSQVVTKEVVKFVKVRKMNKISLIGGYAPQGVDVSRTSPNSIVGEQQYNIVGGLGYSRRLGQDSDLLLGVQALSNKTATLVLDLEF